MKSLGGKVCGLLAHPHPGDISLICRELTQNGRELRQWEILAEGYQDAIFLETKMATPSMIADYVTSNIACFSQHHCKSSSPPSTHSFLNKLLSRNVCFRMKSLGGKVCGLLAHPHPGDISLICLLTQLELSEDDVLDVESSSLPPFFFVV